MRGTTSASEQWASAACSHGAKVAPTLIGGRQPAICAVTSADRSTSALVLPPRSAAIADLGAGKTGEGLALRTLPVAWAPPSALFAAVGRCAPLSWALVMTCLLPPARRGSGHGALALRRLTAFKCGEAGQQRIVLGLRRAAGLAVRRHGLLRGTRWALGRVVRTQGARRVGEAQEHPRRGTSAPLAPMPGWLQRPLRRGAAALVRRGKRHAARAQRAAARRRRRRGLRIRSRA
jgi:hypothetical protein